MGIFNFLKESFSASKKIDRIVDNTPTPVPEPPARHSVPYMDDEIQAACFKLIEKCHNEGVVGLTYDFRDVQAEGQKLLNYNVTVKVIA